MVKDKGLARELCVALRLESIKYIGEDFLGLEADGVCKLSGRFVSRRIHKVTYRVMEYLPVQGGSWIDLEDERGACAQHRRANKGPIHWYDLTKEVESIA